MRTLRLINPRLPRRTAADELDAILAETRPGVRRSQRRSAWRARWRWAREHSRWVTVPGLLFLCWWGFWVKEGMTGLVASILATMAAILITGLLYAFELQAAREERREREAAGRGGWIA